MDWIKCITSRLLRAAGRGAGFTLIEVVMAISIFGIVSTAIVGVLTSATNADGLSRQRSIALELAQQQVEYVRQLGYQDAGISGGNPGGVVQASQSKWVAGLRYVLTTRIKYVSDPVIGSIVQSDTYKQVRVVVTRASDSKELSRVSTYLSSSTRLSSGRLSNSVINVTAEDMVTHERLGNVQVAITKTWSPSFTAGELTGTVTGDPSFGVASFDGLEETPTDPDPGYYDVTASLAGYTTIKEDQPPADPNASSSAAHLALARSGTTNTTIRLYKGCTIKVTVIDQTTGLPYTAGPATVTIASSRGSEQFQTDP
ncbi:MAG: prepilin-type N-terminal cleavage/methylation domain-containing protein, partial [Gaiellaceae bacterium]